MVSGPRLVPPVLPTRLPGTPKSIHPAVIVIVHVPLTQPASVGAGRLFMLPPSSQTWALPWTGAPTIRARMAGMLAMVCVALPTAAWVTVRLPTACRDPWTDGPYGPHRPAPVPARRRPAQGAP